MILWVALASTLLAFGISVLATPASKRVAARIGMMDIPAKHKAHAKPTPLLGGSAIFLAILMPSLLVLALVRVWTQTGCPAWLPDALKIHLPGAAERSQMALGILAGATVLHILGLLDDRWALGPIIKLIVQIGVSCFVVIFCDVRVLTVAGPVLSIIATVIWLVVITNAFNFLDNMDGLSAGMAAICAAALLGAAASLEQVFVSAWLCLMLGALLGFLPHNFAPASTYMGDAGSLVIGFLLAVVSCLTTYARPEQTTWMYGVFVPLIVMAVPLYDTVSVITLRIREGRNPMIGDRRHFSHRLLRRGMSVRAAVLTIYLCTAATAISASLLPHIASPVGAALVFCQTILILLIIALLESTTSKS